MQAADQLVTPLTSPGSRDDWDLVIGAHRGWWDLQLAELWGARELICIFVQRDFVSVYKQTALGPIWHLIQPLLTTGMFTVVFGGLAGLPTNGSPRILFYLAGTVLWTYFASCLTATSSTFAANAGIFGKVYFPRLTVPISVLISRLVTFAIQFGLFLVCLVLYGLADAGPHIGAGVAIVPLLLVIMAGLGLGLGLIITALTTKYRDLQQLVGFGVQLLMYASPLIYPVSFVPAAYKPFILANPLTPIFEAFRWAFLGAGTWSPLGLLYSAAVMLVTLTIGILLFNRVATTFVDTI
jgi:lipopolysaccharide transport system permease protein